jgi:hypothetical protein
MRSAAVAAFSQLSEYGELESGATVEIHGPWSVVRGRGLRITLII